MKKSTRRIAVSVTLPPELVEGVDHLAEAQDRSRSHVTAAAISEYLAARRAEAPPPDAEP